MKSSDYWKQRFTQLERSQTASSAKTSAEVQELYNSAKSEIENRLYAWYGRLAANNGVSMSEARRLLKADELDEFHWSVQQYIKRGKECAVNNQKWFEELENASAKFHIAHLEALETNLKANFEILAAQKDGLVSEAVKDAYRTGYYQSCFEVQRGFNVGFDIGAIDEDALNKLIRKPWAADGYNFSERIWRDKTKLINLMHSELTRSVMLGSSPEKAVKAISKAMDTSLYNAKRLVMTENSYFHALGEQEMYSEFGFDKYEVVAAFDASRKTCELCAEMDGKVFLTKDFAPGVNANPFHPNCHCTSVPYFDDDEDDLRFTRLADGKGSEVPSEMRYEEWKREFANGDKTGLEAMSASQNNWAGAEPVVHTVQELDELREYANSKGIKLYQRKPFNGDIDLLKAQINTISKLRDEFKITSPIQVGWTSMNSDDFARTSSNYQEIWINKLALMSREITEKNLSVDNFLAAEIAEGISAHEMGHIISSKLKNGKTGLDIYKQTVYNVSGKMVTDEEALALLQKNVSQYSIYRVLDKNGNSKYLEIIPEMLSVEVTKPTKYSSEFFRLLREECGL